MMTAYNFALLQFALLIILHLLWGIYAVRRQQAVHDNNTVGKYIFVFTLNAIFAPITMIIAIIKNH